MFAWLFWYTMQYDSNNNLIQEKEGTTGYCATWEYDSNNNKIKQTTSDGNWTKWTYDSDNNRIKEEDSYGNWIKLSYDSNHNVIKKQYSNEETVYTSQYDSRQNLIYQECTKVCTIRGSLTFNKRIDIEYYPNWQLKRIDNLHIPLI